MPPMSPAGWLDRLERRLHERWARIKVYDAYYEGDQRIAFATAQWNEAFGSKFGRIVDNWCEIVVDSSAERLEVQGFRFGKNKDADDDAWDIWQANNLDGQSNMVHSEAIKLEESYWLVQPNGDTPKITAEHPSQVIVAHAPGDVTQRTAALKKWIDEDGFAYANVYLPTTVVKYRSESELRKGGITGNRVNWKQIETVRNTLGKVPVVPVRNNPTMLRGGRSDLKPAIPIQDALNKELSDMLIGSEYLAFPQRVLLGVEIPKHPPGHELAGQPNREAALQFSQARLMMFGNPDAKVAEFAAADLGNYVKVRDNLLRNLTAKCRIPPHYVLGEIVNASGDALKAAEVGLTKKVKNKQPDMGEGHEEAMRLAFKAIGDETRSKVTDVETIWADAETRSFGELVDGLTKLATIGVPREVLWSRAGFSPTEIDRMREMEEAEQFLTEANDLQRVALEAEVLRRQNGNASEPAVPAPS